MQIDELHELLDNTDNPRDSIRTVDKIIHYDEGNPDEDVKERVQDRVDQILENRDSFDDISEVPTVSDVGLKYQIESDDTKPFSGRHVVNSNTKRKDNHGNLIAYDLSKIWDRMPLHAHRSHNIDDRTIALYQMCRSNPEIGGFDRKMQYTIIKREDVDVNQVQTLGNGGKQKRGIVDSILRK